MFKSDNWAVVSYLRNQGGSRGKILPDWHVLDEVTTKIFLNWGIPQIDLFETSRSKVVPAYASIEAWDSQAAFINAFNQTWRYNLAWIFPPPPLIPRVLQHQLVFRNLSCDGSWILEFWILAVSILFSQHGVIPRGTPMSQPESNRSRGADKMGKVLVVLALRMLLSIWGFYS
ncbi:putative transposon Ty3-I Gag-Pol polyprotein [Operophtera brumata]|uniref:Putative transposon Ty3-I Gag-Pol polyprotein n=1 Tax=Operophtera brumata TaxID=104452 RepID=A0A0L7KVJ6_OPEBR|nr:putative transposon Ty3-I Gag-Pol polyprotein [Operophtera brumata]